MNSKEEEEEGKEGRGRTRKGTSKRRKKMRAYEAHKNYCPVVIKFIKELNNAHLRILLNWL